MSEAPEERRIWSGTPSQWINLPAYAGCAGIAAAGVVAWRWAVAHTADPPAWLASLLALPLAWALWRWLVVRFTNYELTSERLRLATGVLNRRTEELELYRVKDSTLEQPILLRIFGLSNVVIRSSDPTHPSIALHAIRRGAEVREDLRRCVETLRARRGVREVDVT
jgi:uncharacterized membrane protein YdbT with pleckstrin-like domain